MKNKIVFSPKDPTNMSALNYAVELKKHAKNIGFEWKSWEIIILKIKEELKEVEDAIVQNESKNRIEEELGDLLFSVSNLASYLEFNSEETLIKANIKFESRVNKMIKIIKNNNSNIENFSLDDFEKVWDLVKKGEYI